MTLQQERMTAKPQPPSGKSEHEGSSSPRRPATRPAQLSLDGELCDFYLMAVVRDKKPADAEKMAQFLWGEAGADVFRSEALSIHDEGEGLDEGAMLCSTPLRLSSAGQDHIYVGDEVWESARPLANTPISHCGGLGGLYRRGRRRASCPAARPSWLLWSGSLVPDADSHPRRSLEEVAGPWVNLGWRWGARWMSAGSLNVPRNDGSHVPPQPEPTQQGVDSCSSNASSTSWSTRIASNPGPSPRRPSALEAPAPETAPSRASALAEPGPVKHSRPQEVAVPKPFNVRQILCYGGGEPVMEPSCPPTKRSERQEVVPEPFNVRQILCYGGGGPDENPGTTRSTVRESSLPAPSARTLTLSQLLGYGGGETDEEPPSPPLHARSPIQSRLSLPLPQRASRKSLKSRMSDELSACVAGKQSVTEGRVVSPPAPPAPVAAMCAMRVKHGATGWI